MAVSLAHLFMCSEMESLLSSASVATGCKRSACGRAVYRVTYPVRQLVSCVVMIPVGWMLGAAEGTRTALENRQCNLAAKLALSVISGVCAFVTGLTLGIAVSATLGLVISVGKAICEPRIDEMDTILERFINMSIMRQNHMR